ncbi:MAG: hypothetical protein ACM319_09255 [Deltaproteobacteria bacterium]|nr:hypothetical protein [Candidatus Deferrimicrobiaceae bacterium]
MVAGLMEEFRSEVEKIFGEDLVSLTIYGAHASDEPPGREENVSVLVVVREIRREELAAYRNIAHRYARRGIPAPPIFTEGFLKESSDVFPLEFLGMASQRRVIFGKDIVPELNITTRNLRHQVEFELKGKLLTLRRMYMEVFGNRELVGLLQDTVGSVVSVARGLLLLSDREAPHEKIAILDGIEKHFGVSLPAIREVIAARQGRKIPHARAEALFFLYQEEVGRLCSLVDEYPMETAL